MSAYDDEPTPQSVIDAARSPTLQRGRCVSPNAQGGFQYADAVDHPGHYQTESGLEAVDVIEAFKLDWHLGNALKYVLRAGKKSNQPLTQDLEKAVWYLRRRIEKETT